MTPRGGPDLAEAFLLPAPWGAGSDPAKGFGLPGVGPDLGGLRARVGGFLLRAETAVSDPVKGFGLPGRQSRVSGRYSGPDLGVRTSLPGPVR